MVFINHINLGDVQKHAYLKGTITQVYPESDDVSEEYWDTADVLLDDYEYVWEHAPIFYHCYNETIARDNAAIIDGAKGFVPGDKVFVLCEIVTPEIGSPRQVANVKIIGHQDGPVKCAYNYVLIRCSLTELEELVLDDQTKNQNEYCTVFDVARNAQAVIPRADNPSEYYSFPCLVNSLKPFLLNVDFLGTTLWESFPQGDDEIEIAGCVPNWLSDPYGDSIRGDAAPSEWWTTYDVNANPVQNLYEDMCYAIMLDDEGASNGTYQKTMDVLASFEENITTWDERSLAFGQDFREYTVAGAEALQRETALGVDGNVLGPANSRHIQSAFGEQEIWICAVNTYMGMIVSYCDSAWKFSRYEDYFSDMQIPYSSGDPLSLLTGTDISNAALAVASDITTSGQDSTSLWSTGELRRINEGCYHRTQHPALSGSKALRSLPIPEDTEEEPQYLSALNFRKDRINIWYRYDNWSNTFGLLAYSFTVNPSWFFRSVAQRWGCEVIYIDTPLGSMWYESPNWQACVYYLYALQTGSVTMSARQDKALHQDFKSICKHSHNVVCQVYTVQRSGLTLWSIQNNVYVKC